MHGAERLLRARSCRADRLTDRRGRFGSARERSKHTTVALTKTTPDTHRAMCTLSTLRRVPSNATRRVPHENSRQKMRSGRDSACEYHALPLLCFQFVTGPPQSPSGPDCLFGSSFDGPPSAKIAPGCSAGSGPRGAKPSPRASRVGPLKPHAAHWNCPHHVPLQRFRGPRPRASHLP